MANQLTIDMPRVEEIKPCPYASFTNNDGVSFILKEYDRYSDFVLFDDGKPSRCFRFNKLRSEYSEDTK